jgi:hypothetical protein
VPVKRGAKVIGALWAWFGTVDPDFESGCGSVQVELEAQDVRGHSFAFDARGTPEPVKTPPHLPGLTKQAEPSEEICKGLPSFTFGPRAVDPTPH